MKAMVFAAGRGTRLKPLTDTRPKALVEVGGVTLLEHTLRRLAAAGVAEVIINLHHCGEQIPAFVEKHGRFGLRHVEYSPEPELLDTGGGLKNAAWFFDDDRPFFLHNVDVLSEIDLGALFRFHQAHQALATLAVQCRPSSRLLLFDQEGQLCGRETGEGVQWAKAPLPGAERLAFTGIHVIDPAIFPGMIETGIFPIMQTYLRLAGEGEKIIACRVDGKYWQDIGSVEKLEQAREAVAKGRLRAGY